MGIRAIDCISNKNFNRLVIERAGKIDDIDIEEGLSMTKTISEEFIKSARRLR